MNELALFAGAGGGLLGSRLLGWRTVCAVEIEPYCREVLLRRQRDGLLDLFPIWDDVRTFDGRHWAGVVDIVTAGFPCQPFSVAGRKRGEDDTRNMWPQTIRVIREVEPGIAFLENVPHLVSNDYFADILGDLAEAGFHAEWDVVSACELGAPHTRDRVFIVAYTDEIRLRSGRDSFTESEVHLRWEYWKAPKSKPEWKDVERWIRATFQDCNGAGNNADVQRGTNGLAHRMDRIAAIGNGQVPAVVRAAWKLLSGEQT